MLQMNTRIVCLCGSTKFKEEFIEADRKETLAGNIVLSRGLFGHPEDLDMEGEQKHMLDQLHLRKIEMSDEILVINKDKYIGSSTGKEIHFAKIHGKTIRYLEAP